VVSVLEMLFLVALCAATAFANISLSGTSL
jgi:hypothetical protein